MSPLSRIFHGLLASELEGFVLKTRNYADINLLVGFFLCILLFLYAQQLEEAAVE